MYDRYLAYLYHENMWLDSVGFAPRWPRSLTIKKAYMSSMPESSALTLFSVWGVGAEPSPIIEDLRDALAHLINRAEKRNSSAYDVTTSSSSPMIQTSTQNDVR